MRLAHAFLLPLLLSLLLPGACARLPGGEARGTPAEAAATQGFAKLSFHSLPRGAAVALAPGLLATNAHVVPDGAEQLQAIRGDGAAWAEARLIARSATMDLALLAVPPGIFAPLAPAGPAQAGQALWAAGAPAAGAAVATGQVLHPGVLLPGHGPGFTARLPALLGYSGGPAVDAEGRLLGLVTALPQPGAAPLLAALSGFDLEGLARRDSGREVFLLSVEAVLTEAVRLLPAGMVPPSPADARDRAASGFPQPRTSSNHP